MLRAVPEAITVAAFTLDAQHEAVRALQTRGYAAGQIKRSLVRRKLR